MSQGEMSERLSRISTMWSLVQQAHGGAPEAAPAAQRELMQRYCGAVYRYLLGALRDEEAATELFQEFALRFVRGDFRCADPERGRFRDYVKTALIHLVHDYRREQRRRPAGLHDEVPDPTHAPAQEPDPDLYFLDSWREELVNQTWDALAKDNPNLHLVLLVHSREPEISSSVVASRLAEHWGRRVTANQVRVSLHRAREKFARLLVEEVARSLGDPTEAELLEELRLLRLAKLCDSALTQRASDRFERKK